MKMRWMLSLGIGLLTGMAVSACDLIYPPERQVCGKVATLCKLDQEASGKCQKQLGDAAETLGKERLAKLASCVSSAQSCPEAGGCMAGVGLSTFTDAANKFLQGVGKALGN